APVASNAGGAVTGAVVSVALPAAGARPAGDGSSGLWQTMRATTSAAFAGVFTNASLWAEAPGSNIVAGALAADTKGYVFEDPATGLSHVWPQPPAIAAYRGWIYLEGGRTYVFGSRCADSVFVAVDGRTLVSVVKSPLTDAFGSIETEEAGWHEIEVRVGHTTSTFGPDGNGASSWTSFGVAFNANGSTSPMPESGWTPLLDDGSGALLRPSRPEARTLSLVAQGVAGGSLTLSAKVGSGENAAHAYLVYGAEDAGIASIADWQHSTDLGEAAASAEATDLAATVAGWGSAAKVARLVLETEGMLAWTEPVTFTDTALPRVLDVVVSGYALGDRATFAATVSGGAAPYAATLLVGTDASSLAAAATAAVPAAGGFSLSLSDLVPGAQHWFQVVVADASGATARSEVLSFVTPGASRVYEYRDGNSESLWQAANPFENRQRTILFGGTLSELGAGETTVRLLRNQTYYGAPGARTTVPHEGEELVLSAAGRYTLPVLLDWDWDVTWNWSVSNATETLSWGPTSTPRDSQGWARVVTVVDATAYTWAGGEGLWNDPERWTPDGVWADVAGYPRRGSYAVFPAGTNVVSVPDAATTNRFSRLTVQSGADVTIRAADGATDATLRMQSEDYASSPRNYGYSQAANSTLRFAGEGLYVDLVGSWACLPSGADTTLEFADGVRARIGNGGNNSSWSANAQTRSRFCVTNGAVVTVLGQFHLNGAGTQLVVDDATFLQSYSTGDNSAVCLRGRGMDGRATVVIRGANPVLQAGRRFIAQSADSAASSQYVDFEVPEGGWAEAPIRSNSSNAYRFGQSGTSGYRIVLRVPTNCPAALAGETLDVPLVRWPGGVYADAVELSTNNLPHPATDYFYTTPDTATGDTTLWARLVGWADTDAPQASDVRVAELAIGSATVSFSAIPGRDAAGAFLATAVSAQVLDGDGEPVEGATVALSADSVAAPGALTASLSGLPEDAPLTLRIVLSDGTHDPVEVDFAFVSAADYAEGTSEDAAAFEDGPFTVWTFTDTAAAAQTLTVTKAGWAEVLVVGGGGSGGG
ncbi:MAG: hypothetical protein II839_00830, partial [Kiritimatiellae bacterium]|nr:hypothetical protein [Kiritimatiellia bacterium]